MAVAIALAAAGWRLTSAPKAKAAGGGPIPVSVETVAAIDTPEVARSVGTVTPLQHVAIRPQVDGVLAGVYFKEGAMVEKGALLAKIDDRALVAKVAQSRAEKASNQAQLVAAQAELARYKTLAAKDLVAQQALDEITARVAQLEAAIAANQAAVAAGQVTLSYARITSPIAGRVGIRKVDPGNVVRAAAGDALVTVTQVAPISVIFSLSQEHLGVLGGLRAQATPAVVVAYAEDGATEVARGTLTVIDNAVDPKTGSIALRAQFDNQDGALWPGQFVAVALQTSVRHQALTVSTRVVRRNPSGAFVYRVVDGKAAMVPVVVGYQDEHRVVITSGLAAGDVVVADGQSRLRPDAAVKILDPAPAKSSASAPAAGSLERK